jgi:hypothetical protein
MGQVKALSCALVGAVSAAKDGQDRLNVYSRMELLRGRYG